MPTKAAVASGTLNCATVGNTVDLTVSGFGTPTAAILVWTNANTTNNPQSDARIGFGFWEAGGDVGGVAVTADNAAATTEAGRILSDTHPLNIVNIVTGVYTIQVSVSCASITDGVRLTVASTSSSVSRYVSAILIGGTLNEYIGTVNLGTGTSAIDVTAPGFKPDIVFVLSDGAGSTSVFSHAIASIGVAHNSSSDVVSQGTVGLYSGDALATTQSGCYVSDQSVVFQAFADSLTWRATIGSFDSSGFSLTPSANAGSDIVRYLALQLADPDDAYVAVIDSKTSTGTQATTGAGFAPDVLGLLMAQATAVNTITQTGTFAVGVGDASTQAAYHVCDDDGAGTSDAESYYSGSNIASVPSDNGTTNIVASLQSLDSDGWTLDYSAVNATARKFLAFAIGDSTAGGGSSYTLSAPTYVPGSITSTGLTARVTVTAA